MWFSNIVVLLINLLFSLIILILIHILHLNLLQITIRINLSLLNRLQTTSKRFKLARRLLVAPLHQISACSPPPRILLLLLLLHSVLLLVASKGILVTRGDAWLLVLVVEGGLELGLRLCLLVECLLCERSRHLLLLLRWDFLVLIGGEVA